MKYLLMCLVSVVSLSSFAQDLSAARKALFEKSEACGQAIDSNSEWFAMSLPNTVNGIGHIRVSSLLDNTKTWDFPAEDTVVDIKVRDNVVYVLTETTFEAWNFATQKKLFTYASHPYVNKSASWYNKASGFILLGDDKAVIAHLAMGLSVLNFKKGFFERTIKMPTISNAQDITALDSKTALVVVDNASDGEFRGLYLFDLNSLTITKQIKVDNAMPFSVRVLPNNRLMLGYINGIWKLDLAKALASKEAQPNRRTWRFPGLDDVDMRGKVFYDEKYMYSCFGIMNPLANGYYTRTPTPLAFDLKDLHLD